MAEKKRASRIITKTVGNFEELVSVKRSIYPWDSLVPEEGEEPGLNYYLKRKIKLIPVVIVAKVGDKVGVLCSVISDDAE